MMTGRSLVNQLACVVGLLIVLSFPVAARAEDGYQLWLRYAPLPASAATSASGHLGKVQVIADPASPTVAVALAEFDRGLPLLLSNAGKGNGAGIVLALTSRLRGADTRMGAGLAGKPSGAFRLAVLRDGRTLIAANDERGLLYGVFALLRRLGEGKVLDRLDFVSAPVLPLRMLDHWDDTNGHVERGYSGRSIFDWWRLPGHLDARLIDYARANASIGINAVVVNNVNASAAVLTAPYIAKLKRMADAFRPYGIRVFLSARFSAPKEIGGLDTADPLDPRVRAWWRTKADEFYTAIPDFGGFLVKANSEGQPGPQDYGRSHADGANMLAQALGKRGTVIWRAFVYKAVAGQDRTKQSYDEFSPLDGAFAANVILQIKNGPLDFQPREPFHPLFGAMPRTRLMIEAQITKEYLGQGTHLVYLAPLWKETLDADTGRGGGGQPLTVAGTVMGGGMAGVANIGSDRNWCGTHFDQANWFAFGRLAWDPSLGAEAIAREWAAQTFNRAPRFLDGVVQIMMPSRQAAVDYMTPLGLAHQMATGHHYGPGPWVSNLARADWNPVYYSQADKGGIGFDRTANGSNALAQYAPSVARRWSDPATMDQDYLLWFHHMPWDYHTASGRTTWEELIHRYDRGVAAVDLMRSRWAALAPFVDRQRFRDTSEFLAIQDDEARWWRDASIAWFAHVSGRSLPAGVRPPAHPLEWYQAQSFADAPGN
jgi:alpha-glucuronidase